MSKRFDNKRLLLILVILAVILLITFFVKRPVQNGTLKSRLADFDTSSVASIIIHPRTGKGDRFELFKKDGSWFVKQDDIVSRSVKGEVDNMINEVLAISPGSLASVNKSGWKAYNLTDSLATRVEFLDRKGKILSDIMFGRMSYKQTGNSQYSGYGGNNLHVTSYVRLHNDRKVYAVDGFLSFTFNTGFDDWRDKTLIKVDAKDLTKLSFNYPADSSFTLIKDGNSWKTGGINADSAKVAGYLNALAVVNGGQIADNYTNESSPLYRMTIEGDNNLKVNVDCYAGRKPGEFIIHSGQNQDLYFSSEWKNLPERLFRPSSYFLSNRSGTKK
ncbi:MAG TPA: DUF4340 domain-containing protein [Bacteroidales bacterium]|nr:DUF4340 domain-containing protein [Bacteroidales bacterium]